jgi:hypothetical protein
VGGLWFCENHIVVLGIYTRSVCLVFIREVFAWYLYEKCLLGIYTRSVCLAFMRRVFVRFGVTLFITLNRRSSVCGFITVCL